MDDNRHVRILLIEDNPGDARLVRESLAEVEGMSFDLERVTQLSAGMERLDEERFDAILLDLSLPDSRGLDTFTRLFTRAPGIPIIVLTGLDDEKTALNAVRGGAQDYLVKGRFDGNLLARAMEYAIERKRVEEALRESEQKYRDLVENINEIMYTTDRNGILTYVSPAITRFMGYDPSEIIGRSFSDLVHQEDLPIIMETFRKMAAGSPEPELVEFRSLTKSGEIRWIRNSARAIFEDGCFIGINGMTTDITRRKKAEEGLEWELAIKTSLAELSNAMLAPSSSIQDIANIVLDYAKRLTRSEHGYVSSIDPETGDSVVHTLTQMIGKECKVSGEERRIIFPIGSDGRYHGLWGHALNTRKAFYTNSPDTHPQSRGTPEGHIPIKNFLSVPAAAGGELVGQIALANSDSDYSERDLAAINRLADLYALAIQQKWAEEKLRDALQESEQQQAEISALLGCSRAVLGCREFQDAARAIFNSCKSLIGADAGYVALSSEDGAENEVVFLDSGGLPCTVDPSLPMPIRGLRGEVCCTGQVVYHNEFSRSEWMKYMPEGHTKLDNVLFAPLKIENKVVGLIGLANRPGGFTDEDARLASAFGEFAAIALRNSRTLESLESSERHFRSVVETASDAIITADSRGNIVLWNNGAERIFGYSVDEVVNKPITSIIPGQLHEIHQKEADRIISTAESDIRGAIEAAGLRKDESEFPIELSRSAWEAKGETFFTVIIRDITERKEEEARKAAEQELEAQRVLSVRSDRLRSLGQMSAGIAHELDQPLVGVRGMAERLLISLDRGWELTEEKIRDMTRTIIEQADRMVHIIEHVRTFAREAGKPESRPVHVNDVIGSSTDMLGAQFRSRGIQLKCELMEDLPVVSANPFSLEEVIINLLLNARDALEEGIEDGSLSKSPQVLLRTLIDHSDPERCVKIEVIDNGMGIPEQVIDRVFDPFFTTKGPDRGTGLGLAISKSIVESFGGTIHVQSTPGSGTVVTIFLPVEKRDSQKEQ